jgi:hypothetical protein
MSIFKSSTLFIFLLAIPAFAQKPADFFPLHTDRTLIYRYFDKNLDYPLTFICARVRDCSPETTVPQCAFFEMSNLPGKRNGRFYGAGLLNLTYKYELADSLILLRMIARTLRDDNGDTQFSKIDTRQLFLKVPLPGKKISDETLIGNQYHALTTAEWVPAMTVRGKKFEEVLLITRTLKNQGSGKLLSVEKRFFARNTGLIRLETYDAQSRLDSKESYELDKVEVR